MEHYIGLTILKDAGDLKKIWFKLVRDNTPSGVLTTTQHEDKQAAMLQRKKNDKITLTIPLTRDLTEKEVEKIIKALDEEHEGDYSLESSTVQVGIPETLEVEVEVDHGPLIALATAWAKQQHDGWVKEKLESGWRYGPSVSVDKKTHPLLRQWSDLPTDYQTVDTSHPEALLKLFNDHGYVLIPKTDLERFKH